MSSSSKKWQVLIGVGIATLLLGMDYTIVNTCLDPIQAAFKVSINQLQWVMTGFGLTFCTFMAISGRLGDMVGRRITLYISMGLFALVSLGAGLSQDFTQLVIFRMLQGVFAAALFPCSMAIICQVFPKEQQGRALGLFVSVVGIGIAIGPVIGGLISSTINWRWIFFVNIPIVIVAFLTCLPVIEESRLPQKPKIDWLGSLFFIISLGALVFLVTQGKTMGWTSLSAIALVVATIVFAWLFVWQENRCTDPILPLKIFTNRGLLLGSLIYVIVCGVSWIAVFFMPLFLHSIYGYSTGQVGLAMIPLTIGLFIFSPVAGTIYDKKGPTFSIIILMAVFIISLVMQLMFTSTTPIWFTVIAMLLFGFCWGWANGIGGPLAISQVDDQSNIGAYAGASGTVLNVSGVMLLAIATGLFSYFESLRPLTSSTQEVFVFGFHRVMLIILGMTLVGLIPLKLLLKKH